MYVERDRARGCKWLRCHILTRIIIIRNAAPEIGRIELEYEESIGEMKHADKLINRIVMLVAYPIYKRCTSCLSANRPPKCPIAISSSSLLLW